MPRTRAPTRRLVLLAGFAGVALALAAALSIAVVSQSSFRISSAAPADANRSFEEARQRFPGASPLLKIVAADGHRTMRVHREYLPASPALITTIRGLAWRPSDGTLAEVRLPVWFVRMKLAGSRATLGALLPDGWDVVQVSADDLVRHGPGLLLDEQAPNGNRLLLWAE
jgi:hypothetical protein